MKYFSHEDQAPLLLGKRQLKPVDNPGGAWRNYKKGERGRGRVHELTTNLLVCQKSLCAYCEISLLHPQLGFHIEHILSKSLNPELTFEYKNLMLSCFKGGGEVPASEEDPYPVSCGHALLKSSNEFDEALFIRPTEADCERYFFYELDGEIVPHDNLNAQESERAQHTIDVLNLNCRRLKRLRGDVIDQLSRLSAELVKQPEQLQFFIQQELSAREGALVSFWTTRKQLLIPD
ncbi:retron system putative HNH endonuclease [Oceanospirillum beijerinckii]|uniref:retron system putative HNH endonuclease n=1 Tax=Oceanospirillum beijerinckii TaxID=64976 RepID=UPI0004290D53|nr:retron system putative HNH endonuclease [Oceanospirillum beijerinckii]